MSENDPITPAGRDETSTSPAQRSSPHSGGEAATWVPLRARIGYRVDLLRRRLRNDPGLAVEVVFTALAVVVATWVILATLDPRLLLRDTTPTGGDMGAHVWGPAYLKEHVLSRFSLTGWTHDWFNGFPAYQFYMVIPSLLIVILNVGLSPIVAVPVALLAVAVAIAAWAHPRLYRFRRALTIIAAAVAILSLPLAYNPSFKIVTVLGVVLMPLAAWAMARLGDLPFPIPAFAAVASLIFLYNREPLYLDHGNIIGGNLTSTLAGEFAFSISLTLSVLYLGVAARGLRTGRHRALAAVLFALAGLCHLIPAFFVLGCTAALFLLHPDRARFRWMATMVPVGGLLTAFWVLPFWWRRDHVNDMGWERLPEVGAELSDKGIEMAGDQSSVWYYLFPPSGLRWVIIAALVGVAVSIIRRYRIGLVLALAWAGVAVGFALLPQGRLWNARLLPFQYLVVVLLAAIGVGELIRIAGVIASGRPDRPFRPITVATSAVFAIGALVAVIMPVNGLFEKTDTAFGFERRDVPVGNIEDGETVTSSERQVRFKLFGKVIHSATPDWSPVSSWARWNYTGLEDETSKTQECTTDDDGEETCTGGWPEYRDFISTMTAIGDDDRYGCGRMMWEFNKDRVNTYGTTMAPMLLPYWTDGCIASQEGLYFESTPSVPFHFMVQSELSTSPSRPQRFVNWPDFDIDRGVKHLQMLGVRYYGAITSEAISAAEDHPDLTLIAETPAWHVYMVDDAPDVAPLDHEPVVVEDMGDSQDDWLPVASAWFQQGDLDVPIAVSGPDEWERVRAEPVRTDMRRLTKWLLEQIGESTFLDELPDLPRRELPDIEVMNIHRDTDSISFDVSEPGVPVLVKTSHFPNWSVSGADGIHRVAPNLMVVVPEDTHVELHYGRTPVDIVAYSLTLVGLIGLLMLSRARPVRVSELGAGRLSERLDALLHLEPRHGQGGGHETASSSDTAASSVTASSSVTADAERRAPIEDDEIFTDSGSDEPDAEPGDLGSDDPGPESGPRS